MGGLFARKGRDDGAYRHPRQPLVRGESDIKKHARLNMMAHLLSTIDYADVEKPRSSCRHGRLCSHRRPPRELSTPVDDYGEATIASDAGLTSRPPGPCCSDSLPMARYGRSTALLCSDADVRESLRRG